MEFLTLTGLKRSEETTNLVILIINGVGKRDLGMIMVFCHLNQAKIEACDALSALHQCSSSEPSVVVVRRYSITPYILRGMCHPLYLHVGTLSEGASSTQFPLDRLCLHWLIPFTKAEVLLRCEEGKKGWRHTSIFQKSYGRVQRRNIVFPIQSLCQSPC